jgi:exonuclease VII small subunit
MVLRETTSAATIAIPGLEHRTVDEPGNAYDILDLTVGRAIDDATASIEAGDIDHALEALERAVKVSESHPIFSKRATSEFQRVEALARICERVLDAAKQPTSAIRALINRVRALKRSQIH